MKKILFLFLFVTMSLVAQNHAFKINPSGFFNNGFEASYENYIGQNSSIEFVFGTATFENNSNKQVSVSGGELRYKLYTNQKNTFKGLYISPAVTVLVPSESTSKRYLLVGAGCLAGYQFMLGSKNQQSGFIFDVNLGLSYYISGNDPNRNLSNLKGFQPRYGLSFGYAF